MIWEQLLLTRSSTGSILHKCRNEVGIVAGVLNATTQRRREYRSIIAAWIAPTELSGFVVGPFATDRPSLRDLP